MTIAQLRQYGCRTLREAGILAAETEIRELAARFLGLNRLSPPGFLQQQAQTQQEQAFLEAVRKRCSGYPLQYLLGSWSFMGCELSVGEGVLIPRDDTEVCVRACIDKINARGWTAPRIVDLCSGSGAIAIALAKRYPEAVITAVELSPEAVHYLEDNIRHNGVSEQIRVVSGDIGECYDLFEDGIFDVIISNPPYICSAELPGLQKEVQCEPEMALDGGTDGLVFYRLIAEHWLPKLRTGGILSLEIGEQQGQPVSCLLKAHGRRKTDVLQDLGGLDRAVISEA